MNQELIATVAAISPAQATVPVARPQAGPDSAAAQAVAAGMSSDRLELSGPTKQQAYVKFRVNEQTGDINVEIIDAATDQVIREIPSEETARIAQQLQAYLAARAPRRS